MSFSEEEASSDPSELEPQYLAPNDAMVFHQVIKNCAPEKVNTNAPIKVTVRHHDALTHQPARIVVESTFAQLTQTTAPAIGKGTVLTYFIDAIIALQKSASNVSELKVKAKQELNKQFGASPGGAELKDLLAQLNRMIGFRP